MTAASNQGAFFLSHFSNFSGGLLRCWLPLLTSSQHHVLVVDAELPDSTPRPAADRARLSALRVQGAGSARSAIAGASVPRARPLLCLYRDAAQLTGGRACVAGGSRRRRISRRGAADLRREDGEDPDAVLVRLSRTLPAPRGLRMTRTWLGEISSDFTIHPHSF